MEITWYGLSCFRLTERGQASIVTDPYKQSLGLPLPKLRADVVTISHDATGHNHLPAVTGYEHALTRPGEYEIRGVFVTGIATALTADERRNVLFMFDFGGITVAHLGDMNQVPPQTQIEALEKVDVLLVPVGGGQSLNAAQAAELVSMLEPSLVVPMHYHVPGLKLKLENVERFLNEMGVTEVEEESRLRVSAGRLPEETAVVLLKPKALDK
jgi:L-ascorbate metabolism protein UlaG (beta-lactamase superfamily)